MRFGTRQVSRPDQPKVPVEPVTVGLLPTDDSGVTAGACCSSSRPMHWPELWPVQGMPSTAGRLGLPGMLLNTEPEFGTVCGCRHP